MEESLIRPLALKRIQKDYQDLLDHPLKGAGIIRPDDTDPFTYIINVRIMTGVYEGIILQLKMEVPRTYPKNPPKVLIMPNQHFSHQYHHHIFKEWSGEGYSRFCLNLLENDFYMNTAAIGTGWSSAYTFRAIILQLQNFLSDPDMKPPSEAMIETLRTKIKYYTKEIVVNNEKKLHTFESPFPPLGDKDEKVDKNKLEEAVLHERLTCYYTKTSPLTQKDLILGYPILLKFDHKQRIEPFPIPEIVSYDGYMSDSEKGYNLIEEFDKIKLKTAYGQKYNFWMPIFVSDQQFNLAKSILYKHISILKHKDLSKTEKDFKENDVLEVFPPLLSKMIVFLLNGSRHSSISAIEAYCHYLLLLDKLISKSMNLAKVIDDKVESVLKGPEALHKKEIPDIGNFIILLFFSKFRDFKKNTKIISIIFREYIARQMFWIFQFKDNKVKNVNKILDILLEDENIFKYYEKEITEKSKEMRKSVDKFEELLEGNRNFFKSIFHKDKNNAGKSFEYSMEFFNNRPEFNTIKEMTIWEKSKQAFILAGQIKSRMKISEREQLGALFFKSKLSIMELIYYSTDQTKEKIMKLVFNLASVSNHLLIFTFMASKRFINEESMEHLSKNYGVVDQRKAEDFLTEIFNLQKTVDSYEKMFELIGLPEINNKEDICSNFFRSVVTSNRQKYSSIFVPREIYQKYNF